MVFNSVVFLFCFLPLSLLLYYLVPGRAKNAVLLLESLVFAERAAQKIVSEWSCGKNKEEKQKAEDDYERDYYDIAG